MEHSSLMKRSLLSDIACGIMIATVVVGLLAVAVNSPQRIIVEVQHSPPPLQEATGMTCWKDDKIVYAGAPEDNPLTPFEYNLCTTPWSPRSRD